MQFAGMVEYAGDILHSVGILAVDGVHLDVFFLPFERVLIHIGRPSNGRNHGVTVQVLHIADGDIDSTLVNLTIQHIQIDHEFVAVKRPIEIELGQLAHVMHRCRGRFVSIGFDRRNRIIQDERYLFVNDRAVRGLEYTLVIDGEDLLVDAIAVLLHLIERQISHQTHLVTYRRDHGDGLQEGLRQRLLKDRELVYITGKIPTSKIHGATNRT